MTKPPSLITLREGENVSLVINASGNPAPDITWSVQEGNVIDKSRYMITADRFDIRETRFEDQGIIMCRAENLFGVQETKVKLTVGDFVIIWFEWQGRTLKTEAGLVLNFFLLTSSFGKLWTLSEALKGISNNAKLGKHDCDRGRSRLVFSCSSIQLFQMICTSFIVSYFIILRPNEMQTKYKFLKKLLMLMSWKYKTFSGTKARVKLLFFFFVFLQT